MKSEIITLCASALISSVNTQSVLSKQDNINRNTLSVINTIETLEETDLSLLSVKPLIDVEGNHSYGLYIFNDNSYAIATCNGIVSEYCIDSNHIPFENAAKNSELIYAGPFCYLEYDHDTYILNNSQIIKELVIDESFLEVNKKFLESSAKLINIPKAVPSGWTGLDSSYFYNFSTSPWYNSNNTCGQISLAILMAYYQDRVYPYTTVPASVRTQYSSGPGQLLTKLYQVIGYGSTTASNLYNGFNGFYTANGYPKPFTASYSAIGTAAYAYPKISNHKPVVIGMLGALGSTYGNHFVVAYQYSNDTLYYRCVDTLGSYQAVVNVSWTSQCLWING